MKRKYIINKELRSLKYIKAPLHKPILPLANLFLKMAPKGFNKNKNVTVTKHKFLSFDNSLVSLYVIDPLVKTTQPALIYFHGGGFVLKAARYQYYYALQYALKAHCKVIFIDYRLAPKYKFPTPLNDCYYGYLWVIQHANELNIDTLKISLGGDSAGGHLALGVNQLIKNNTSGDLILPSPIFLMLVYPVIDNLSQTKSMIEYTDSPVWNALRNKKMWDYYLGENSQKFNPLCSFNNLKTYQDFPIIYIETAEYDCLRDEAIEFYHNLKNNNIEVILNETKETVHGYDFIIKANISQESLEKRISILKKKMST